MPGLKLAKNKNTESPVFKISMFHLIKTQLKREETLSNKKPRTDFHDM